MKWKATRWIALWLILVSAVLLIAGTYAAYTRIGYVKRVVSTKNDSKTFLFSSNYLYSRETASDEYPLRIIPVSAQEDIAVTVTVCNYLQSDLTKINEETIQYDFTAQLVDKNGNPLTDYQNLISGKHLSISNATWDNVKRAYSASGTLNGGSATTHFYEITCQKEYVALLNDISIRISAVPTTGMEKLVATLSLCSSSQSGTAWSGKFAEVTNDSMDTTVLDAFNYVISGTEEATVRITWDTNHVALSEWFVELFDEDDIIEKQIDGKDYDYIIINVGKAGTSYTLQFYRVNGIPANETGEDVRQYVSLDNEIPQE